MKNNYFNKKDIMAEKANNHLEYITKRFSDRINKSIEDSVIIEIENNDEFDKLLSYIDTSNIPNVKVIDSTSEKAILNTEGECAVLNFASFKNPGGMFMKGSSAQEESLCHVSTLYPILKSFDDAFYAYNRYYCSLRQDVTSGRNRHMYLNRAIFSRNVDFFYDNYTKSKVAGVITCAAPNYNSGLKAGIPKETNSKFLERRIKFVFEVLLDRYSKDRLFNNIDNPKTLILGAYGCGVFNQNPFEVAYLFKRYIDLGYANEFDNVVFAIPKKFKKDYDSFSSVFFKL